LENSKGADKRLHVLVIDDEEGIRYILESKLYQCGYLVTVAATGLHAAQKIKSGKVFDLILCDLKMPGISGLDLFRQVKALAPGTPFILITGYPERDKVVEALKLGVKEVVLKPVKHADLMEKIKKHLGASASSSSEKQTAA